MRREKSNYIIQAVAHAFDVLEQFHTDTELGVTELSRRLTLHKNNVFRILATLESRGYIEQNRSTENYHLGAKCLQLGQTYIQHTGLLQQARAVLHQVVRSCRETAYVTVMRQGKVVPVEMVEPDQAVRLVSRIGESLPLHCTAAGKVHLAFEAGEDGRRSLLDSLQTCTDQIMTDRSLLEAQLNEVSRKGYALEDGEHLTDVRTAAVPVRDYTHAVVGSLAVSAPAYRVGLERLEQELVPLIIQAGKYLSSRLGHPIS